VLWQIKQGNFHGTDSEEQHENNSSQAILPTKLEQMVKKFKMHRCTMDFNHSFCKAIYKEE